jgi:hypothetical protein
MIINSVEIRHPKGDRAIPEGLRKQAAVIERRAKEGSVAEMVPLLDAASILRGIAEKAEANGVRGTCAACEGRAFFDVGSPQVVSCRYCDGTGRSS